MTGIVRLIKSRNDVPKLWVTNARQMWMGEICIAIYDIDISNTIKANPPLGIAANAKGPEIVYKKQKPVR